MLEGSNCYWYCWYITCLYVSEKKIRGDSYCRAKQRPSASSHYVNPHCVGPHLQAHFWGRRPSWGALHEAPSGHPPTDILKLLAINNGIQYYDNWRQLWDGLWWWQRRPCAGHLQIQWTRQRGHWKSHLSLSTSSKGLSFDSEEKFYQAHLWADHSSHTRSSRSPLTCWWLVHSTGS